MSKNNHLQLPLSDEQVESRGRELLGEVSRMSARDARSKFHRDYETRACQIVLLGGLFSSGFLPAAEWAEFIEWEELHVDGSGRCGSSDWPGWYRWGALPKYSINTAMYAYRKKPIGASLRTKILERDGYRCRKCGSWENLHVDHVLPERLGGTNEPQNLQTLCRTCNLKKKTQRESVYSNGHIYGS